MRTFSKQVLIKPPNLTGESLIAVVDTGYKPETPQDIDNLKYSVSEVAFNETQQKIQIYVKSEIKGGLDSFKLDFPNAEIRKDGILENPEQWKILAYPHARLPEEATPIDNYYQERSKEFN